MFEPLIENMKHYCPKCDKERECDEYHMAGGIYEMPCDYHALESIARSLQD